MPIRFRCVYCDKLLGISRRKAGAVVDCPHCREKLIVPTPVGDEADEPAQIGTTEEPPLGGTAEAGPQLFERSDFEALLQPEPTYRSSEASLAAPPAPLRTLHAPPPIALDPIPLERASGSRYAPVRSNIQPGIVISPARATWLSVAAVLLLAIAFGAGILVGRFFRPGVMDQSTFAT